MKEEFETYADALWWGLVSHHLKLSHGGWLEAGRMEGVMWTYGVGQLVLQHRGEEGRHLYLGPPGDVPAGALGRAFLEVRALISLVTRSLQGPYLSLARLCCADSVAEADVYPRPSRHT